MAVQTTSACTLVILRTVSMRACVVGALLKAKRSELRRAGCYRLKYEVASTQIDHQGGGESWGDPEEPSEGVNFVS